MIPTITSHARTKTTARDVLDVAETLSIILPLSPTVTDPTLTEFPRFLTTIGELTVILAFLPDQDNHLCWNRLFLTCCL